MTGGARPKPSSEPKIYFIPYILSFRKTDWKSDPGKRIKIAVNNPQNCHIIHASIKLMIPSGWEFLPDTSNNVVNFDPDQSLFWVHNLGYFKHNYTESWFEIKPGPHTSEGIHEMYIHSLIFFNNINSNINYTRNFTTLIRLEVINDINETIVKEHVNESKSNIIKENIWFFIMISSICALVGLIVTLKLHTKSRNLANRQINKIRKVFKK